MTKPAIALNGITPISMAIATHGDTLLCSRGAAPITCHQKSMAVMKKVMCWMLCTKPLRSAGVIGAGIVPADIDEDE